jgi:hypothetical protein
MLSDFLKKNITSQAGFIADVNGAGWGYGQVEPNHLSAQATKEVYAQLPANKNIAILENGQFAKYDYANEEVNFTGPGEWLLVFNEIKLYRDGQSDAEFAMIKDNYNARVYSPFDGNERRAQSRFYNGVDNEGNSSITLGENTYSFDDVTAGPDMYEIHYNEDPFHILGAYKEKMMPEGTKMVPRLLKTHIGDIFTTNMIADAAAAVKVGKILVPDASNKGILTVKASPVADDMQWQVVKVYTMPDGQPGVKVMRIK